MHDGYRPEIDGLRAVAVLGVVAYHAGLARVTGGFVGVDVFFVISGYLITSLILREGDAGRFSLRAFWGRRIRRLAPAMILMLAGSAILAHLLLYPLEFKAFARALIAQPFLLANVLFYLQDPYFAPASATMPLLHTWSLAVEEQFYLVYPLTLLLLIRAGDRGADRVDHRRFSRHGCAGHCPGCDRPACRLLPSTFCPRAPGSFWPGLWWP